MEQTVIYWGCRRRLTWSLNITMPCAGLSRMMKERINRLNKILGELRLEGILLSSPENLRYITGFTGSDGLALITSEDKFFLTDSRYTTQAEEEVRDFAIEEYKIKPKGIVDKIKSLNIERLGFEAEHMSFDFYRRINKELPNQGLIPLSRELKPLRSIKEKGELELIAAAVRIASESLSSVLNEIKPGVKEKSISLKLEYLMKKKGADKVAFDIIVASGKRSALPHGVASEKELETGDFVIIDFGISYRGYHSDETCTLVIGKASKEQKKVYQTVKDAHDKAIDAIKPGVKFSKIDFIARNYIEKAGYGNFFGHGLGHGVGLTTHEEPSLSPLSDGIIEAGMVFTVEPGIYIPHWGGVRIEDMVLSTKEGCNVMTFLPKKLQII